MIYYGTQLYGKVDVVPGAFFVATRFIHIYAVPLVPLRSYIVLEQSGNQFRGVKMGFCLKSILLAYGRTLCFVVALAALLRLIGAVQQRQTEIATWCGVIILAAVSLMVASWKFKALTRASYNRACRLAQRAGFNALGMEALRQFYGMPPQPPSQQGFPGAGLGAAAPPPMPGNRQPAH